MRKLRIIASLVCIFSLGSSVAFAQTIKSSALAGVIVTKSATIAPSTTSTVYTTPASGAGFFILTQLCVDNLNRVSLSGSTFGAIVNSTNDECTRYAPGIAFPPAEDIKCQNTSGGTAHYCTITGVISK